MFLYSHENIREIFRRLDTYFFSKASILNLTSQNCAWTQSQTSQTLLTTIPVNLSLSPPAIIFCHAPGLKRRDLMKERECKEQADLTGLDIILYKHRVNVKAVQQSSTVLVSRYAEVEVKF